MGPMCNALRAGVDIVIGTPGRIKDLANGRYEISYDRFVHILAVVELDLAVRCGDDSNGAAECSDGGAREGTDKYLRGRQRVVHQRKVPGGV